MQILFVSNPLNYFVLFDNTTQRELMTMNNNGKNEHSSRRVQKKLRTHVFLHIEPVCVVRLILTCTAGKLVNLDMVFLLKKLVEISKALRQDSAHRQSICLVPEP